MSTNEQPTGGGRSPRPAADNGRGALAGVSGSKKADWSLISCLAGFLFLPAFLVAIALGVLALRDIQREPEAGGRSKAILGICLGAAGLVVCGVFLLRTVA